VLELITRSMRKSWRRAAGPAVAALIALAVAACSSTPGTRQIFLPDLPKQTDSFAPAAQREHQRVLAAYGGAYEGPKTPGQAHERGRAAGRGLRATGHDLQDHDSQFARRHSRRTEGRTRTRCCAARGRERRLPRHLSSWCGHAFACQSLRALANALTVGRIRRARMANLKQACKSCARTSS
jgi:hypothetical protein